MQPYIQTISRMCKSQNIYKMCGSMSICVAAYFEHVDNVSDTRLHFCVL